MEHLIIKYINKEISEEELALLKEGLKNPEVKKQLKEYIDLESSIQLGLKNIDMERVYNSLDTQLSSEDNLEKRAARLSYLKYAAAITIIIALAASFQLFINRDINEFTPNATTITLKLEDGSIKEFDETEAIISVDDFVAGSEPKNSNNKTDIAYNEINVPYGKKATIKLSDNSQVILNSGSVFKYPTSFDGSDLRSVTLEGEAYFTVSKNAQKPFIVQTAEMDVEVLGTEFNVSCFKDDKQTLAILVEGSIKAKNTLSNTSVIVKPGQAATLKDKNLTVQPVDIQKYTAWLHGDLLFIDDTFETVLKKLERHFNVVIINNNPALNEVRYNGRFNTETLEQILEAFQVNTTFEYTLKNNQIIIKNETPMK
ncbi:FecR family protein [Zhouia amylolytica]|uniref:FecR family protein n=1 Tax=Zhouia amylolytica TaxID=376730 RepID=UPI0020CF04A0|nr:FecR domain-containing protein [Zhouia amylolytica]MCQ0112008.1 FecR domain-containing protein [Zhouia amylolytica]